MLIYHVYKRPGYDKWASGYDEFAAGEWHFCGAWNDADEAHRRADSLVEEGTSVRMLASVLNPSDPITEKAIEFGVPVRGIAETKADQETSPKKNTSPITQSPDSSPSKSFHNSQTV